MASSRPRGNWAGPTWPWSGSQRTPPAATGFCLADNRTAELSKWDDILLASLIGSLESEDPELYQGLLFDALHAELVMQTSHPTDGQIDPDDVPSPPAEATSRKGDLWILGDHRLVCGDSGNPLDVDRLLDGKRIHLVHTDPPYNVKVEPRSNNAIAVGNSSFANATNQTADIQRHSAKTKATTKQLRAKDRPLANDCLSDKDFTRCLRAWFATLSRVLEPGRSFYIWGGYANIAIYPPALSAYNLFFSQAIIWVKEHPVLSRKDFMGNHEWCFYGWKGGAGHEWFGPMNIGDVWNVKKVAAQAMVHLTEKPVELAIRAMEYSSRPKEHVLDLFGGSGSTLIAAEQMQRKAFLVEFDPLYCDVIVERWQKFTGRAAQRIPAVS